MLPSSLSTISATSITKSSQDNTNQLSSIPEGANDSTLIGNYHHLSETGEFLQPKSSKSSIKITKLSKSTTSSAGTLQQSKMLPLQITGANETTTSTSLQTIGEELDRVQNRLATNATDSSNNPINEQLLSSSLKTGQTNEQRTS